MPRSRTRVSIGDARSLNWRTHVLFAVPALLAAGFFDFDRLGGNPGLWLLLSIIGLGATVGAIELLSAVTKKRAWKKPKLLVVLGILFLAGLSRGATLFFVGGWFGIVPETDLVYRLIGGPVFVISIYILVDTMVSSFVQHREQAATLTNRREQLERAKTGFEKELARLTEAQRAQVRELVAPSVWELQKFLGAKTKSVQDAIFEIKALNEQVVRPLSKEMSGPQDQTLGQLPISEENASEQKQGWFPEKISISDSVNLGFFALVALILGFNSQSAALGIEAAALLMAVTLPIVLLAVWLFLLALRGLEFKAPVALVLGVGYGAVVGFLAGTATTLLELSATDQFAVQGGLFVAVNMLFTMGLGVASIEREKSLTALEAAVEELSLLNSRLRQQVWLSRKTLAMELHGSIQATLQSVAARLSKLKNPSDKELQIALEQVRSAFERVDQEDYLSGRSLQELLDELMLLWEGALDLQIRMDSNATSALLEDQGAARCVLEVCREAVTNAVKHGAAEQVVISIVGQEGFVKIEARDDGTGKIGDQKGQGINLYKEVSHTFKLKSNGDGVTLELQLPLSVTAQP
jgi:signal transduction histidine kinase